VATFAAMLPVDLLAKIDKKGCFAANAKMYTDVTNVVTGLSHVVNNLEAGMDKEAKITNKAAKKAEAVLRNAVAAVPPQAATASAPPAHRQPSKKSILSSPARAPPPPRQDLNDGYGSEEDTEDLSERVAAAVGAASASSAPGSNPRRRVKNGYDMETGGCGLCLQDGHAKESCRFYHCRGCHRNAPGHTWGSCKEHPYKDMHPKCAGCKSDQRPPQTDRDSLFH
jgi:hypothetical protein